jgi:hypothetical protein
MSPEVLKGLQAELVRFYAELPDAMKWSVDAFKAQEARGHGVGCFVHVINETTQLTVRCRTPSSHYIYGQTQSWRWCFTLNS